MWRQLGVGNRSKWRVLYISDMITNFLNFKEMLRFPFIWCIFDVYYRFYHFWVLGLFIGHLFCERTSYVHLGKVIHAFFFFIRHIFRQQRRNISNCQSSAETTTTVTEDWNVALLRKYADDVVAYRLHSFTRLSLYDLANCESAMKVHVDMPRVMRISAFYIRDPRF